jgi:MFS family permease
MNAFYASQFVGMGLGPLLGGIIGAAYSYEAAFYAMGAVTAISIGLVLLTVPADRMARTKTTPQAWHAIPTKIVLANDAVKSMLVFFATRGFWLQSLTTFYPLLATTAFSTSESGIGLVLSAYMFSEGLFQIPFGFLADRYPRVRQIAAGSLIAPLLLAALPFLPPPWAAAALAFVVGAFSALARAPLVAIRTELGRTYGMARLAGIQGSSFAVGQMLGPVICGAVIDWLGLGAAFPFVSFVGVAGGLFVLWWLGRWLRNDRDARRIARLC